MFFNPSKISFFQEKNIDTNYIGEFTILIFLIRKIKLQIKIKYESV